MAGSHPFGSSGGSKGSAQGAPPSEMARALGAIRRVLTGVVCFALVMTGSLATAQIAMTQQAMTTPMADCTAHAPEPPAREAVFHCGKSADHGGKSTGGPCAISCALSTGTAPLPPDPYPLGLAQGGPAPPWPASPAPGSGWAGSLDPPPPRI
ncbi:MAG: hypothetical protein K9H25_02180 [Rhodospirillum sp.]|nr:hypothetical protein [Rhodospirillum sp.]MCF8487936.1 hypothetical protein [Rhodospirillum sp.]MCF8499283.1 hypothetical protein [Rhodospirillum sp.]